MAGQEPKKFIAGFDYERALESMTEAYSKFNLWDESGRFNPVNNHEILIAMHTVYLTKAINDLRAETKRSSNIIIALTVVLALLTFVMAISAAPELVRIAAALLFGLAQRLLALQ